MSYFPTTLMIEFHHSTILYIFIILFKNLNRYENLITDCFIGSYPILLYN
jgi:hypothetical protein